ncbi:hypothetical protein [Anaplasma platys]|uniref:hypothetical protein n=1 Tax=Anaplasma platys TaxID=949 RepID=UPI001F27818B|nr:hypothetical protein [Anaplasma platys]
MVFFSSYVSSLPHAAELNNTQAIGAVEFMSILLRGGLTVAFGALSDVWGRKAVIGSASVFLLFPSIPVFWLLSQESVLLIASGYLIFHYRSLQRWDLQMPRSLSCSPQKYVVQV